MRDIRKGEDMRQEYSCLEGTKKLMASSDSFAFLFNDTLTLIWRISHTVVFYGSSHIVLLSKWKNSYFVFGFFSLVVSLIICMDPFS